MRSPRSAGVLVNVASRPELCDFTLPALLDRDPVAIAIFTDGASPILARRLRAKLEQTIPTSYGRLAQFLRAMRPLVAARIADPAARRRFWESALDGAIAEFVFAGDEARARATLESELARFDAAGGKLGEVFLVGAGPGDPDLLTLRALRLMQQADVVLYDRLVSTRHSRSRPARGGAGLCRQAPGRPCRAAGRNPAACWSATPRPGKRVLRLKGGDPFVFGRGGEEIETLAEEGVPFQVCPGITAAVGCSAYSGIPLTHRDHAQACVFVTAHGRDGPIARDWKALIHPGQTVAIYMALGHLEAMIGDMIAQGVDPETPAAIVDNGARVNQRVVVATLQASRGRRARRPCAARRSSSSAPS